MNTIKIFNTTNLGSIAKIQTGPFGSQLHERDYVEKGTPIITVEHLGYGRIIKNDIPCVSESDVLRLKKFLLKTADIVFSRVGSVDRSVLIRQEEDGWMFSGRCLRVRVTTKDVLPAYLYYYFTQNSFRQYVRNNAVGATMPSLNSSILRRLKILYPSLSKQKQINDILSAIDDTLTNNYTRIQLLEEAARLLFREWFVYFRFPGHEKVKIVDSVPEGWKKEKINKFVTFKRGVEPGSDNYLETYESGSFPFFRVSDLVTRNPGIFVDEQYAKGALLKKSDIVISLDGSVGIVSIGLEGCYSTGIRKLIIKDRKINRAYLFFLMKSHYAQGVINAYAKGTTIQHAGEAIKHMNPILPPQNLMDLFDEIASPALNEILILLDQNQKLAQARDLLLPRLMSGAIEV
jgi:type I restriction enzyme S subunit